MPLVDPKPGTIIDDRYEVVRQLGAGGMGSVYVAIELELNRQVAVKLLHPGLLADEEQRARFEREGRILSSLSHPNILTFFRFGMWQKSIPYIVMEYLEGLALRDLIDQNQIGLARCIDMALQMASALQYAHNQNVVHRDIKPTNILVLNDTDHTLKILDFGLARVAQQDLPQHLTQTGDLIGSVFYMSPEQCTGKRADARSDIYSLGCVIYEMCTGEPPFTADNPIGLMHKHATEDAPLATAHKELTVDESMLNSLNGIIQKCMKKAPDDRYQTMDELAADLQLLQQGKMTMLKAQPLHQSRVKTKRPLVVALTTITLTLLVSLLLAFRQDTIDTKPIPRKVEGRVQRPLGWQGRLSVIIAMQPGLRRYNALKNFIGQLESQNAKDAIDTRALYATLCIDSEIANDGNYMVSILEPLLKDRMKTNPSGVFTATLWDFLARNYVRIGAFDRAEEAARTALKLFDQEEEPDPSRQTYALQILCRCLRVKQNKFPDEAQLSRMIDEGCQTKDSAFTSLLSPELAYLYLLDGREEREKELFTDSIKVLTKASYADQLRYFHNLANVLNQLGKSLLCKKRLPEWLKMTAVNNHETSTSEFQAGEILLNEGMPAEALQYFDGAARHDSKDTHLLACLAATRARTLMRLERYSDSAKAIEEAIKLSKPPTAGYLMALAIVCAQKDQFEQLEKCLDQYDKMAIASPLAPIDVVNHYRQLCDEVNPIYNNERRLKYMLRCRTVLPRLKKQYEPFLLSLIDENIALAYDKTGQHRKALAMMRTMLPRIKKDPTDFQIEAHCVAISSALHLKEDAEANVLTKECLRLLRLSPQEALGAWRMRDLAYCYVNTNHLLKAEEILIASCADRRAYGTLYDDAAILLARFYNETDQPAKAIAVLKKLDRPNNNILKQRMDIERWAHFELEWGCSCRLSNQLNESMKHFRNATRLCEKVDCNAEILTTIANEAGTLIAEQPPGKPDPEIENLLARLRQDRNAHSRGIGEVIYSLEAEYLLGCNKRQEGELALKNAVDFCKQHPSLESHNVLSKCAAEFDVLGMQAEAKHCRELASEYIFRVYFEPAAKRRMLQKCVETEAKLKSRLQFIRK